MKKILKSVLALALVLATVFSFAGCKIVVYEGNWESSDMTYYSALYYSQEDFEKGREPLAEKTTNLRREGDYIKINLLDDGKGKVEARLSSLFTADVPIGKTDITWKESDGEVTATYLGVLGSDSFKATTNKYGKLVIEKEYEGASGGNYAVSKVTFVLTRTGK